MKKQYINPTVEIIDIEMDQHLLAGSVPTLGGDLTGSDPILAPELGDDFDFNDEGGFTLEEESFNFGE